MDPAAADIPRRGPRRRLALAALGIVLAAAGGELVARLGLGLGDPPLSDAYPDLEYAFRPGTYRRFGNTIRINSHHMRSDEFPDRKERPDEFRVLLMGDSVVNGGALTDQADLASEVLRERLTRALGRPAVVGNVSAGSWGPGNLLAYARRFGLFDADVVVVVLTSMDAGDVPTGRAVVGVDPSFPARRPWSALGEAVTRYLLPRIQPAGSPMDATPAPDAGPEAFARGMRDLGELADLVSASGARLVIAHFPDRGELAGSMLPGHDAIAGLAAERDIPFVELSPAIAAAVAAGSEPYRPGDSIHPNAAGQRIIADSLLLTIATIGGQRDGD